MSKYLFFDPVTCIYAYTTHNLISLRQKALLNAYNATASAYKNYRLNVMMEYAVNNKRRFKGQKPLRKRTWKRLKGS